MLGFVLIITEDRMHSQLQVNVNMQKVHEPSVSKAHWAFVIEEMSWLSGLIANEARTKKTNAKKCARMVQKHFSDKAQAKIRAERNDEMQRRKTAAFVAKEIKTFWSNIEKLFEYRLKSQIDAKRKRALDEHLNLIVDRTEKFSSMLAESLNTNTQNTPNVSDVESVSSVGTMGKDEEEYEPDMSSDDDEATIGKEDDKNEEGEIDMLNEEADIPVEELIKKFHPEMYEKMQQESNNE